MQKFQLNQQSSGFRRRWRVNPGSDSTVGLRSGQMKSRQTKFPFHLPPNCHHNFFCDRPKSDSSFKLIGSGTHQVEENKVVIRPKLPSYFCQSLPMNRKPRLCKAARQTFLVTLLRGELNHQICTKQKITKLRK